MNNKSSFYALIFAYLLVVFTAFLFYPKWKQSGTEATISWDVSGYYIYLPATFIYKDLKHLKFGSGIIEKYQPTPDFTQAFNYNNSGNYVMNYALGQAVTMSPWFGIGHLWAKNSKYDADGYSYPYQMSLGVGMLLYTFLGLALFRKNMLRYFSDKTVAITILILIIGTNYLNYSAIDQCMTHNVLFLIYNAIIFLTYKFHQRPNWSMALIIGFLCGLAILIRPTEIICILIPILWEYKSLENLKTFLFNNYKKIILAAGCTILVGSLQLFYWKYVTGDWFVYSYREQGFSFLNPHIKSYCMDYGSGWLRYTPIMIFSFIGTIWFLMKGKNRLLVMIMMLLSFWLVTSWDVWDYGGTAGRAMVQYYPFLMIPIATIVEVLKGKRLMNWAFYGLVVFCSYINIWFIANGHGYGRVLVYKVSKVYYWATLGRWQASDDDTKLLDNKHVYSKEIQQPLSVYSNNKDTMSVNISEEFSGNSYTIINTNLNKKWLRSKANFYTTNLGYDTYKYPVYTMKFYCKGEVVQTNDLKPFRFIKNNIPTPLTCDAKVPQQWDSVFIHLWNPSKEFQLSVTNLEVVMFDE